MMILQTLEAVGSYKKNDLWQYPTQALNLAMLQQFLFKGAVKSPIRILTSVFPYNITSKNILQYILPLSVVIHATYFCGNKRKR